MAVIVDAELCTGCKLCLKNCPYGAVELIDKKAVILDHCTSCGACIESCPVEAIASDAPPREAVDPAAYGDVWVLAEQQGGKLSRVAIELLGQARRLADPLGQSVVAPLLGSGVGSLADELFACGADKVLLADDPGLAEYATLPYTRVLADLLRDNRPAIFLIGATRLGRDLAPRLARRLDLGLTADCTGLEIGEDGHLLQTRPAFGGNIMAAIVSPYARPQMATVRPGIMEPIEPVPGKKGEVETVGVQIQPEDLAVVVREILADEKPAVDFHQARIIVSGGRGVGGSEGFALLEELAGVLGAQLGGTRVAVEEGWIPVERQIGQTGQTVRPELYIACGISGAIQHRAGILDSRYIVSINRDPGAPIHAVSDFRLVGDLFKIVPAFINAVKGGV